MIVYNEKAMNRMNELEKEINQAKDYLRAMKKTGSHEQDCDNVIMHLTNIETLLNNLPIHIIIARFLKEQATEHKTEQENIVIGLMHNDLYIWDFDVGRAMQDQWQTKKIIDDPLNRL